MNNSIPDRYEQNPMLVLVENYVLDTLGLLEPEKSAKLNEIVCRTFGTGGGNDWRKIIREQFQLPPDTDTTLQQLWNQRQEEATETQQDLSPETFAQQQADQLFQDMGSN